MKIIEALKAVDLLAGLSPDLLDQLAPFSLLRSVRAGETIFCQEEPSPYCFGVVSGEIAIHRASKDRRFPSKILSVLGPGSLFGESALFQETRRTAMATAKKEGVLVAILGGKFREGVARDPAGGLGLLMGMLQNSLLRLHQTSAELSLVFGIGRFLAAPKPAPERILDAADFLRASLEDVDEVIVYRRNPYGEEFEPFAALPQDANASALPLDHPLVRQAQAASGAVALGGELLPPRGGKVGMGVTAVQMNPPPPSSPSGGEEVLGKPAAAALVPLVDCGSLIGFLRLASQNNPAAFSPHVLLLLSAVAVQFSEALFRQERQEDFMAQSRLDQARRSFIP